MRGNSDMSLYADYLRERTTDEIIELDNCFATFRYVEEGKAVYIVDIYTTPEARKSGLASKLADEIAMIAKEKGCTSMLGTCQPTAKGSTLSLKALLGYGLQLHSCAADCIIMRKEI